MNRNGSIEDRRLVNDVVLVGSGVSGLSGATGLILVGSGVSRATGLILVGSGVSGATELVLVGSDVS
jgi:hypothetical protein